MKHPLTFATSLLRKPRKGNNDNSPGSLSEVFFFCVSGYSHKKSDPGNVTFGVASCIFFVCPFDNCLIIRRCCGGNESERFVLSSDSDVQCPSEWGGVSLRTLRLPDFSAIVVVVGVIHEGCWFAIPLDGFFYHFCYFHNVFILKV